MKYIDFNYNTQLQIEIIRKEISDIYPLPLWKLLLFSLYGSGIKLIFSKKKKIDFPKSLDGLMFVTELSSSSLQPDISSAIYKNKNGKKFVVKVWDGVGKNHYYYSFLNEIRSYLVLTGALYRVKKSLPSNIKNIYIPRPVFTGRIENKIIFVREYVNGIPAYYKNSKEKLKSYFQCIDFLIFLSKHLTDDDRKLFYKRGIIFYIFSYPIIFTKAAISYPKNLGILINSILPFIKSLSYLSSNFQETIAHRDLHFKNIILSKKSVSIVDFQYTCLTDLFNELATTLRYRWMVDDFQSKFIKEITKRYAKRKHFRPLFNGFLINSITHGLTNKKIPGEKTDRWINLLRTTLVGINQKTI